jgi:hypothetical protein
MSTSLTSQCYQSRPGAALQAQAEFIFGTWADYQAFSDTGLGVKATNTPPTNASEFGGHLYNFGNAAIDRTEETFQRVNAPSDTLLSQRTTLRGRTTIPLDANWAVGKYVFWYVIDEAGVILFASKPYRIR